VAIEARAFADTELLSNRVFNHENVPSAVFPTEATVGMTEAEAQEKLGEDAVKIYRAQFRPLFHSSNWAGRKTMSGWLVDGTTTRCCAHMVGNTQQEVIQGIRCEHRSH